MKKKLPLYIENHAAEYKYSRTGVVLMVSIQRNAKTLRQKDNEVAAQQSQLAVARVELIKQTEFNSKVEKLIKVADQQRTIMDRISAHLQRINAYKAKFPSSRIRFPALIPHEVMQKNPSNEEKLTWGMCHCGASHGISCRKSAPSVLQRVAFENDFVHAIRLDRFQFAYHVHYVWK